MGAGQAGRGMLGGTGLRQGSQSSWLSRCSQEQARSGDNPCTVTPLHSSSSKSPARVSGSRASDLGGDGGGKGEVLACRPMPLTLPGLKKSHQLHGAPLHGAYSYCAPLVPHLPPAPSTGASTGAKGCTSCRGRRRCCSFPLHPKPRLNISPHESSL